jgi:hypothetical protein
VGRLAEQLAALTVNVTSPDGGIQARSRGGALALIAFSPSAYPRYSETDLAHQLARTATLLYVGHERAVQQTMEAVGLRRATEPSHARDEAQRRFLEAVQKISVTGSGSRELVTFEIAGMASWHCWIAAGTLEHLPEQAFIDEVTGAARDVLRKTRLEKAWLKNECFGTRLSPQAREQARRLAEQLRARRQSRG